MEIVIKGEPKEIADLVLAAQGRREKMRDPLEGISRQEDSSQHHSKPEKSA